MCTGVVLTGAMNWTKYASSLTILSVMIAASPVTAGETRWFETDGGNVRIVTEPYTRGADIVRGIIDIDLLPGWKTYWRDPGSGGIPPSIQVNNMAVVRSTHIDFPVPNWISSKYGSFAGYDEPVQLPFTLRTNGPATEQNIEARVFIGICKDICIPAFTDFKVPLIEANGSSISALVVANAFDTLPKAPETMGISISTDLQANQVLKVSVDGTEKDLALFVSGQQGEQFARPKLISSDSGTSIFEVGPTNGFDHGQEVDVIVTGRFGQNAFETMVPLRFNAPE